MNKLKLHLPDLETVMYCLVATILVVAVVGGAWYSLANAHYGSTITTQMTVVDKEKVVVNSEFRTYSYHADLLEDSKTHYSVSFSQSHWRQLAIGRTYRMQCVVGYYSQTVLACTSQEHIPMENN